MKIIKYSSIERFLMDLITAGFIQGENWEYTKSQLILVHLFSVIGIFLFIGFGIVHLSLGNLVIGYTEFVFGWTTIVNLILLRALKNIRFASRLIIVLTLFALFFLLITGGLHQTGIFWFYTLQAI